MLKIIFSYAFDWLIIFTFEPLPRLRTREIFLVVPDIFAVKVLSEPTCI